MGPPLLSFVPRMDPARCRVHIARRVSPFSLGRGDWHSEARLSAQLWPRGCSDSKRSEQLPPRLSRDGLNDGLSQDSEAYVQVSFASPLSPATRSAAFEHLLGDGVFEHVF